MVIYITEQYLKDRTNITQNVESKLLTHNIEKAQDMYISNFIGKDIDDALQTKLTTNPDGSTLTVNEKVLLTYMKKALVEFASFNCYVDILFRFQNKAANIPNSDNSNAISTSDLKYVRDIAKKNGNFYLDKIRCFLEENSTEFPTFCYKTSFISNVYYPKK